MHEQLESNTAPNLGSGHGTQPKKRQGCFYYGCLTVVVLVLVAAGSCALLFQYGRASVTPAVEEFLAAAEKGDYDRAYGMTASEWKEKVSRDESPTLFTLVRDNLGTRQSMSLRGIYLNSTPAGTTARADYTAEYDKGEANLTVTLRKENGEWHVVGIFFNSPKLAAALKCPNCGATNAFDAKFCTKCGNPLQPEQ